mgnify:CR=1 FL=1
MKASTYLVITSTRAEVITYKEYYVKTDHPTGDHYIETGTTFYKL